MAFEPTLPSAIRGGTGLLWLALGLALHRGRGDRDVRTLGIALALSGVLILLDNVTDMWEFPREDVGQAWLAIALGIETPLALLLVATLFRIPLREARASGGTRGAVAIGLLGALAVSGGYTLYYASMDVSGPGAFPLRMRAQQLGDITIGAAVAGFATVGYVYARRARRDAGRARDLGWLASGLLVFPVVYGFPSTNFVLSGAGPEGYLVTLPVGVALASIAALAFYELARAPGGRGRAPGATLLALTLGAALLHLLVRQDVGDRGIARAISFGLIAYALREALPGRGSTSRGHRGASAAGALAALFIVAQVAQNFFEAQYGLLMGGVVAGAVLFAADPIQRALEGRRGSAPTSDGRAPRLYRQAVRDALRDRALSRAEEMHLTELAEELRLPASEALRIRHEVEDERATSRDGPVSAL